MRLEENVTNLIAACLDTAQAYSQAATALVDVPDVAHLFEEQSRSRELAIKALEDRLRAAGKQPVAGILIAPAKEGWSQPSTADSTPRAIVAACHRAEERAVEVYAQTLPTLPEDWRWEVGEQYEMMRSMLAKLHAWLEGKEGGPELR
jgi:uncharacterized protein (TIGR02284 family)